MNADVLTIVASIVGSIVGALTVGAMVKGFLQRFTRQVFAEDVFSALKGRKAEYREFHSEVFASELDRGRRTADIAAGLVHDIQAHREEFSRFRASYEGHQEQMILIPRTVIHLDETMKELNKTVRSVGDQLGHVSSEVSAVRTDVEWLKKVAKT